MYFKSDKKLWDLPINKQAEHVINFYVLLKEKKHKKEFFWKIRMYVNEKKTVKYFCSSGLKLCVYSLGRYVMKNIQIRGAMWEIITRLWNC